MYASFKNILTLCLHPRVEAPHSYTRTFRAVPGLASYCNVNGKLTIVKFSVNLIYNLIFLFSVSGKIMQTIILLFWIYSDFFRLTFFCRFPDFGETVKAVFFLADLFRQGPTGRLGRFLSSKCRLLKFGLKYWLIFFILSVLQWQKSQNKIPGPIVSQHVKVWSLKCLGSKTVFSTN